MKRIKRLLAVILCAAMLTGVCVPFASAEDETVTEITQETPGGESEAAPEEGEETVQPEEPVEEEQEKSYSEKVEEVFSEGLLNLERGGLMLACFLVSPIVILFPMTSAVGLILLVEGLPVGLSRLALGIAEVIGSPLIALFK